MPQRREWERTTQGICDSSCDGPASLLPQVLPRRGHMHRDPSPLPGLPLHPPGHGRSDGWAGKHPYWRSHGYLPYPSKSPPALASTARDLLHAPEWSPGKARLPTSLGEGGRHPAQDRATWGTERPLWAHAAGMRGEGLQHSNHHAALQPTVQIPEDFRSRPRKPLRI